MLVSLPLKPAPVTVTEVPGAPVVLLMDMDGVTVKVMSATLDARVDEPYASIVWEPEAEGGIVKVVLQSREGPADIPEACTMPS
jgi:hypothetical protein